VTTYLTQQRSRIRSRNSGPERIEKQMSRTSALMTIRDVMAELCVCKSTVYNLISFKDLVVVKVGGATRIKRASLEAYITRNTLEARPHAA